MPSLLVGRAKSSSDKVVFWSYEGKNHSDPVRPILQADVPDLQRRQLQVHALDARVIGRVLERIADLLQRVAVAQQTRFRLPNLASQLRNTFLYYSWLGGMNSGT